MSGCLIIQATIVLRCSNEPVLRADSKSVRIFEISQQMPKIPTFFSKKEGKKQRHFSGFLISVPYRSNTGKERKKKSCQEQSLALGILIFSGNGKWQSNSTNFLPRQ